MNYSIQLSSIHSPLAASYITLTLTDSNYRVLFPIVQRRQASPFLRRRVLYPAELYGQIPFFLENTRFSGLLLWQPLFNYQLFFKLLITSFFMLVTTVHFPFWVTPWFPLGDERSILLNYRDNCEFSHFYYHTVFFLIWQLFYFNPDN